MLHFSSLLRVTATSNCDRREATGGWRSFPALPRRDRRSLTVRGKFMARRGEKVVAYALDMQINPGRVSIGVVFSLSAPGNIAFVDITVISQANRRVCAYERVLRETQTANTAIVSESRSGTIS